MKLILLLFILSLALSWEYHRTQLFQEDPESYADQKEYQLKQLIDHFDYKNNEIWTQRYFAYDTYWKPQTGLAILYICGEAECHGISDKSFVAEIARETNGIVLSLEHRYYGKSLPFQAASFEKQNMKYLTSEQALKDLAMFLFRTGLTKAHGVTDKTPWLVVGGSYPGAMAAWFQSKYPHLTIGSIASSGVILAIENFRMFDEQIYLSAKKSGDFCPQAIKDLSDYVEEQVTGDRALEFMTEFGAEKLTSREFLFYWSDSLVFQIQYGNRVNFCNALKGKTLQEQYAYARELVKKVTPVDYGAYYLGNASFAMEDGRGARSWIYQSCTEFSYFQTYAEEHPMRSRMLTIDFYRKWCSDIFGDGTWPLVDRVNRQFGGLNIKASNLIMTNGDEDPWKWASMTTSNWKNITTKVVTCDNCAHCVDLHGTQSGQPSEVTQIHQYELSKVKEWLKAFQNITTQYDS